MSSEYVLNAWYMAGWQEELENVAMVPRTFLDRDWVMFKKNDGSYAMLRDRCPHRFAPLSRGKRVGDRIVCGYHGLEFETSGACVRNPFSDLIPPNAVVETWPIVARYGILWFWPGDPAQSDPDTIPDFAFLDDPQPMVRCRAVMEANYEILSDNLLDLSHIEFVHEHSFQSGGALLKGKYQAHQDDATIWSRWLVEGVAPPRFAANEMGDVVADRWTNMRWNAPATMYLEVGAGPHGVAPADTPIRPLRNPHIITPISQTQSHYFYNCFPGEESVAFAKLIFEDEDRPMLEAVQRAMAGQDFWDMRPVILNVDAGAVRARRHLMKLRREQHQTQDQMAAAE